MMGFGLQTAARLMEQCACQGPVIGHMRSTEPMPILVNAHQMAADVSEWQRIWLPHGAETLLSDLFVLRSGRSVGRRLPVLGKRMPQAMSAFAA